MSNNFFEKRGPFPLHDLVKKISIDKTSPEIKNVNINGLSSLDKADNTDITFLNSSKYKSLSLKTKACACITTKNLSKFLPRDCIKIEVKNVLFALTQISRIFYPKADMDYPDLNLVNAKELIKLYPKVNFGENVLIGKNVLIGDDTFIGSNCIIESNVIIGDNCIIGSFVSIKNSLIGPNVHIKDGSKIGLKGFGFIPIKNKNLKTPQVGRVVLKEGVEIGSNCTLDRGSLSDTIVGKNSFLDNQVHLAHNVKIGENNMIAGQVGIAGSTVVGNNVMIGGQAGISGHLTIGDNVMIGGGSGVTTDLPNNSKVMGYPAVPLKQFATLRRKNEK